MTKKPKIWKNLVSKTGVWLAAEIWLNLIGIDDIADYSEFLFSQNLDSNLKNRRTVKVSENSPQFCHHIDDFCPMPRIVTKPKVLKKDSHSPKKEIFKDKCRELVKPCLKILYLATNVEVDK
ncbi:conserved hypothetical protein [Hyella patelloides LEGE 07179]|uniref:Uncharacterized protein n=1 Tax=Hyella patelloides LEGE 07179 TaxID=945734 RepID=A0A563W127_9CYAN|nr:hypothetical protein [Hyella patelloides]VEP17366.1 conserved hypothetical protein [Hyella patelloides LEGE 07179]